MGHDAILDAIVVGGGPAGSTAARLLAARGLRVAAFEASSLPRVKPCGGALTTRTLALLPPGYEALVQSSPRRFTFAAGAQSATVEADGPYCHTVLRAPFDHWLWQEAASAGAEMHEAEGVTAIHPGEGEAVHEISTARAVYRSRYLIGADGAKGLTAKTLGLRTVERGAAMEVEAAVPAMLYDRYADRCEVELTDTPWGYAWVIPKADGVLNVGVGSFRPGRLRLRERLERYLAPFPAKGPVLAHPLPFRWRAGSAVRGRTLLAGDAAGLMDPFSAEGIHHALVSGTWAAECVADALQGQPLLAYDRRLSASLWPMHGQAAMMARLVYPLAGFWSSVFLDDQELIVRYLDVALGRGDYTDLVAATRRSLITHRGRALFRRRPSPA